jgi:hypothetical protein
MKNFLVFNLKIIYRFLKLFGFDARIIFYLKNYPKFLKQKKLWLNKGGKITNQFIILGDYNGHAGTTKGHYFHQDLLVSTLIFKDQPKRHIDIGSRIDGFVAAVASFREIEIIDIRPIQKTEHTNIKFRQADITNLSGLLPTIGQTDSLSCLHAIEHFGLGRYGDQIDIDGHQKGISSLIELLKPLGKLYISFPIGVRDEVHFNAHRIFHPKSIFSFRNVSQNLKLNRFDYVDDNGDLHVDKNINDIKDRITFGCGIYTFSKY